MYNQHTREMATTRHRSLVERSERKAFLRDVRKNPIFTNPKKRIRALRGSSKTTRLFLTK